MKYGLIGKSLKHSFSAKLFNEHFCTKYSYHLYELDDISKVKEFVYESHDIMGFNVTIPYKISVIPFLDRLDVLAEVIGSVNTVKVIRTTENVLLEGYNTDALGFEKAYQHILSENIKKALILGKGGAAKAVAYVLDKYAIEYFFGVRKIYVQNDKYVLINNLEKCEERFELIVNATPVGMYPSIDEYIPLPENIIKETRYFIDLVYNPEETIMMKRLKDKGIITINGLEMLLEQAKTSWKIWGLLK